MESMKCHLEKCRPRGTRFLAVLPALALLVLLGGGALAEEVPARDPEEATPTPPAEATFVDAVTVAATRSERSLLETPGHVDVIAAEDIEKLGLNGVAGLVLFAPGVYVEGDLTRLGSNGFNIRGIGGNRVLTQVDGIRAAEQFDFGPLSVTQLSLDLDALESAEIVRSAGSALYGSNALGGVVSLVTRGPRSYLGGRPQALGLRGGWDGRAEELSEALTYARGNERWRGSLAYTHREGEALGNQGEVETESFTRTTPNPIDRRQDNALLKLEHGSSESSRLQVALEWFEGRSRAEMFSARAPASPFAAAVVDADALDNQERRRFSAEQSLLLEAAVADSLLWRASWQEAETEQATVELRQTARGIARRDGRLRFDQESFGVEAEARKALGSRQEQLLTYGLVLRRDRFDGLRDRSEALVTSGLPVASSLVFPTKYFPESDVDELGLFVQGELSLAGGRLRLVPGLRFDRYDLDPDQDDTIFLSGNPGQAAPVAVTDQALSPKLGLVYALRPELALFAQVSRGFRAPPMSDVNNGFTNPSGGYRTLPNPDLEPETSDNYELGMRGSFGRGSVSLTVFQNRYADFVETVTVGVNTVDGLIEFQPQNVAEVEIAGLELAGDVRFGDSWRLRGAFAWIEGENQSISEPLVSIAPARLVAGLRYAPAEARWGAEAVATLVEAKDEGDLPSGSNQFRTPSYQVLDLSAWVALTRRLSLQVSGFNLLDETYWHWAYVRGQSASSTILDRYTSPGRSFGVQLRAQL